MWATGKGGLCAPGRGLPARRSTRACVARMEFVGVVQDDPAGPATAHHPPRLDAARGAAAGPAGLVALVDQVVPQGPRRMNAHECTSGRPFPAWGAALSTRAGTAAARGGGPRPVLVNPRTPSDQGRGGGRARAPPLAPAGAPAAGSSSFAPRLLFCGARGGSSSCEARGAPTRSYSVAEKAREEACAGNAAAAAGVRDGHDQEPARDGRHGPPGAA